MLLTPWLVSWKIISKKKVLEKLGEGFDYE